MRYLLIILATLLLSGCGDTNHTVEGEVDVNVRYEAWDVLIPFALVGAALPDAVPDDEELYCVTVYGPCITAGDARDALAVVAAEFGQ